VGLKVVSQLQGTNTVRFDDFSVDEFMPQTSYRPACDSTSGCPTTAPAQALTWDPSGQDEGLHQVLMWTSDAVQQTVVKPWDVYLDRTAPVRSGSPTGSLWDNQGKFVREGSYDLHVTASDIGGSGIKDMKVLVDGVEDDASHASQTCGDDCPPSMTRNYTFATAGRTDGSHRIQVIARDKVDTPTTVADVTVNTDSSDPSQGTIGGTGGPPAPGTKKWVPGGSYTITHTPSDSGSGVMRDWTTVGKPVGSDAFARTLASGWGTADRGGAWQLAYGTGGTSSTDGTAGSMFLANGQMQTMQLANPAPRDVDMRVRMKFPTTPGSVVAGLVARRQACAGGPPEGCHVRIVAIANNGEIYLRGAGSNGYLWSDIDTGIAWSGSDRYWIRARIVGTSPTTIQAKLWKDGTTEPSAWTVTKTGAQFVSAPEQTAGGVALRGTANGATSTELRFDKFQVDDLTPSATYAPNCNATSGCPTNPGQQTYTWNTAGEADGQHEAAIVTSDAVEHTVITSWDLYLDQTAPTASGTPTGPLWDERGKFIHKGTYSIQATAVDPPDGSGIKDIRVYVDGSEESAGGALRSCPTDCPLSATRSFFFDTSGRPDGSHRVQMIAHDVAGNAVTLFDITVRTDAVDPTQGSFGGDLAPPAAGAPRTWLRGGSHTLTHTPSDSNAGVMRDWATVGKPAASDAFGRTVASGWGTADRGGAWQQQAYGSGTTSVDGTAGSMFVPQGSTRLMQLADPAPRDVDMRVRIKLPDSPAHNAEAGLYARRSSCIYATGQCQVQVVATPVNGRMWLNTGGVVTHSDDTGVDWAAGARYWLRERIVGDNPPTLQAKFWKDGTPEPASWLITRSGGTDFRPEDRTAGGVGLRGNAVAGGTQEIRFDQFQVEDLTPGSGYAPACDRASGCPTSPGQQQFTWDASTEEEGHHQVAAVTSDAAENTVVKAWDVWLDRTLPTSDISGSLVQRGGFVTLGTQDLSVDAGDSVSGVKSVALLVNGSPYAEVDGDCTADQCASSKHADFTWDSSDSSGRQTITVQVTDLAGNQYEDSWEVTVDASPPDVSLSGPLYDARGTQLAPGSYALHVAATDGDGTAAGSQSGVTSIQILVDDQEEDSADQDCPALNCGMTRDWTFDTGAYEEGTHQIEVRVDDEAGYERVQSFEVSIGCCLVGPANWGMAPVGSDVRFDDVTDDGLADEVSRDLLGHMHVAASNGTGFDTAAEWGQGPVTEDFTLDDADGDEIADLMWQDAATGDLEVAYSDGTAFGPAQALATAQDVWGTPGPQPHVSFADLDGDGEADAVSYDPLTGAVYAAYAGGDGTFEPSFLWTVWDSDHEFQLVDVTGDDAADVVGRNSSGDIQVAVSNAGGFDEATSWGNRPVSEALQFADVDGDGSADAVGRDAANHVTVGSSDGGSFGTPRDYGDWVGASFGSADVTGDGLMDLVGVDPLGQVQVGESNAATPLGGVADVDTGADDVDVEPDVLNPDEEDPPAGTATAAATASSARLSPKGYPVMASGEEHLIGGAKDWTQDDVDQTYRRLREIGVRVVRINAYWGAIQNRDGTFSWDRLDYAIAAADRNNMRIHLTFTGSVNINECGFGKTTTGIGCDATPDHNRTPTGLNPGPGRIDEFGEFVRRGVGRYTRDGTTIHKQVQSFSIWNEPNLRSWLVGSGPKTMPISLYKSLYNAGYDGWQRAVAAHTDSSGNMLPEVKGTQIMIGELSSGVVTGRSSDRADGNCTLEAKGKRACFWTPLDFLEAVVKKGSAPTEAHGVALHPYQEWSRPDHSPTHYNLAGKPRRGTNLEMGISRLGAFQRGIKALCEPVNKRCTGKLHAPDSKKRPGLYMTEFGYRNQPTGKDIDPVPPHETSKRTKARRRRNKFWHTEQTRANWFLGNSHFKGVLDLARDSDARWMMLWNPVEVPPYFDTKKNRIQPVFEFGMIGLRSSFPGPGEDITGERPYGKLRENRPAGFQHHQDRKLYCAIRKWVLKHDYFDPTDIDPVTNENRKNKCGPKGPAHDGD
jgi:hypothetical protein